MYPFTGDVEIVITAAPGCVITSVTLPVAHEGPAENHDQVVGVISFTSDVPCAAPPTVALNPGSVFALGGNTLPTNLKIGPTDVAAGVYPLSGGASTGVAQSARIKSIRVSPAGGVKPAPASRR